jgi:hypothetical protein
MSNWMADLNEMQCYHTLVKEANEHRLGLNRFEDRPRKQNIVRRVMEWLQSSLLTRRDSLLEGVCKDGTTKIFPAKPKEAV